MTRKRVSKKKERGAYNWRMIQDFFNHLEWEIRISHFEHIHPGVINPELVEQLTNCARKYKETPVLLPIICLEKDMAESRERLSAFHRALRERTETELEAMETLRPLFRLALTYVRSLKLGGKAKVDDTRMREVLQRLGGMA